MTEPAAAVSFGMSPAWVGSTRVPRRGSLPSRALVRTMTHPPPALGGSVNGPMKVAPASSEITSPGRALLSAAWRSPPARTAIVRPDGSTYVVSTSKCGGSGPGAAWAVCRLVIISTASAISSRTSMTRPGSGDGPRGRPAPGAPPCQIDQHVVAARRREDPRCRDALAPDHEDLRVGDKGLDARTLQRGDVRDLLLDEAPVRADEPGRVHVSVEDPDVAPLAQQRLDEGDHRALPEIVRPGL